MAALVTDAEVRAILDGVDPSLSLTPFIDQADMFITEDLAGKGLTALRLKNIELNLAAHYYTISKERGGLTLQRIGEAEERYGGVDISYTGFKSTRFGQQALAMDTSGTLQSLDTTNKAEFGVINACNYGYGGAFPFPGD